MAKRLFLYLGFAVFFLTAVAIPIFFQSMTLWYKYGVDRLVLQTAQIFGMIAFSLLYLQVVLIIRGRIMEATFTSSKLVKWHKVNGLFVAFCALIHAILVLLPEGLANLPLGLEFWPELLGVALIAVVVFMVSTSSYRQLIPMSYSTWRGVHRLLGYCALLLLTAHMLFVSDSFENLLPQMFLFVSFSALVMWVFVHKWLPVIIKK